MPNKPFGVADPYYDALRVQSNQAIWPDAGGSGSGIGGLLENKIYLWPSDGSTIGTFDPDETGLNAALAAASSGDTVWLPSMTIALTASVTLPAGVALRGISEKSILTCGALTAPNSFPTTSILDDFNRANTGPPPSASWANSLNFRMKVVNNQLVQNNTNALCDSRYLTSFGQEAEVYIDLISSVAGLSHQEFWLFTGLDYLGGTNFYAIFDLTGPSVALYDSGAFLSSQMFSFGVGDSLGLRITGTSDPVFHVWHKPSGGSWTEVYTYTYTGGTSRTGLLAITSWGTNTFDNFGGGDFVPTPIPAVLTLSDGARIERVTIAQTANDATDLFTVRGPSSGIAYISHLTILCTQSSSGDAIALDGGAGQVQAHDSYLNGQSTSGNGYGARSGAGALALVDCWIVGNTAPMSVGAGSIITSGVRMDTVAGEPAQGDRSAWDTTTYFNRHASDINAATFTYHNNPAIAPATAFVSTAINLTLNNTHHRVKVTAVATITLPTAVSISGQEYIIKAIVDGVIVNTTSSQTIDGDLTKTLLANDCMVVFSDGANWLIG